MIFRRAFFIEDFIGLGLAAIHHPWFKTGFCRRLRMVSRNWLGRFSLLDAIFGFVRGAIFVWTCGNEPDRVMCCFSGLSVMFRQSAGDAELKLKRAMFHRTIAISSLSVAFWCPALGAAIAAEVSIDFNHDIRPILAENCFQCHGPDAAQRKAGLRLDTEAGAPGGFGERAVVVPGKPLASELIRRIRHPDPEERMPPPAKKPLAAAEIRRLVRWVEEGAPWQQHWAFVTPRRPEAPAVADNSWARNEIDRFVLHRLEQAGLSPSPEASRETFIRRASLDFTGLPPTLDEAERFAADNRPDAYERLLDRLLQSPRYGEQMAWQWLEAARYADTDGYQNDGPRNMWRWRDWVIEAYNRNLPFDRFTIEQLAGDLLPSPAAEQIIATGFNRNHRYNSESGLVFEEFLLENAVDRVDTTATVWMGLTAGCARCHDHKYDPISQKEYYQMIAYFNNVPESGRAIKYGNSEPWIQAPTPRQQSRLRVLQDREKAALEKAEPKIASAQHRWEASAPSGRFDKPVLPAGLSHRFAFEMPLATDGQRGVALEKIPRLICNGRFSIAFEMTPQAVDQGAVLSNELKAATRSGILVQFNQGRLQFHIITRWIAGVATLETAETLAPGKTVHVALTNDGTQRAKGMRIYLDGVRAETRALHNSNSNKSGENFGGVMQIGASHHVPGWKGTIQDLRFYNQHTLTPEEVRLLAEPAAIPAILARQPGDRTKRQAAKLRDYYLNHEAPESIARLAVNLRQAQAERLAYFDSLPTTMVMEEAPTPKRTHIRIRGLYHQKGEPVERGVPAALPPMPEHFPKNRLGFARWLVNGEHPLTARVAVNRYWQQLFRRGLVKTPEDFGAQGSFPSHPELLDWLAVEFMESGWDTRHLLKTIAQSAAYRQSSAASRQALAKDPDNHLLSRAPRRRLPGNVLRDQALFLGGLLVEQQGGPSVKPLQPEGLWREASNFTYQAGTGQDLYRRSLYTYWKRTLAPPAMAILDAADREWCSVRPRQTNTPLQALTLLNEPAFFESAAGLGWRTLQHPGNRQEKLRFAFAAVTARQPTPQENAALKRAFQSYRQEFISHPAAAAELLKKPAKTNGTKPSIEWAAYTALANMLLNLDETTARE